MYDSHSVIVACFMLSLKSKWNKVIDWLIDCVNFCLVDSCFVFFQCNPTYPTISERKQSTKNSCNSAGREYTDMFKIVVLVQGNASKRWWMLLRKFWVSENFDATRNILEAFVSLKVLLLCSLKVLFRCIFLSSGLWTTSGLPWSGNSQGIGQCKTQTADCRLQTADQG